MQKSISLILILSLLTGCGAQPPLSPTQTPLAPLIATPTAAGVPTSESTATKSILLDSDAWNDNYGDGYIARLPIHDLEKQPPDEIARLLVVHWLDHYKNECSDPLYRLQSYSVGAVQLDTASLGYEIIAFVEYSMLPAQPLSADYKGEVPPNGYISLPGDTAPDGTIYLSPRFGVFRDGNDFRLRILIGWGT